MGFFDKMKDAMGQAQAAQQQAGGLSGLDVAGGMASRSALESQAREQNRILTIGQARRR